MTIPRDGVEAASHTSAGWTTNASLDTVSAAAGTTAKVSVTVKSSSKRKALVDLEIHSSTEQVFQQFWDKQSFTSGATRTFTAKWNIPAGQAVGSYTVKVGMFGVGWNPFQHWNNSAGTVTVTSPITTSTTAPPTTTTAPATTTTIAPSTTTAPPPSTGDGFIENFTDGEGWRDRFDTHVHFRADHNRPPGIQPDTTWRADHDHDCGGADTERHVHAHDRDEFFYACRDHMMTTMADIDGYGTLAFSPKQTFPTVSRVCWDQNVTDLGGRQWTELVVTPADRIPQGRLAHVSPLRQAVDQSSLRHGEGTVGISTMQRYGGFRAWVSGQQVAFEPHPGFDAEGFESRSIRRQHCLADNGNGTLTMTIDRGPDPGTGGWPVPGGIWSHTFAGSFPNNARVIFEDHNYTPDKDNEPCRTRGSLTGCRYTWHWDTMVVDP